MDEAVRTIRRKGYGAIAALGRCYDPRILLEGPANTGKTSGLLWLTETRAWSCPGIRVLLLRQTMQSLRESVLATLEDKVYATITGGARHPAMHGTATRANRRTYLYPNGTTYVVGGLEDPGWTFSMEYDQVLGFEAWEFSKDAIEKLYRANRNHVMCRFAHWNARLAELVGGDWLDERWMRWHGEHDLSRAPAEVRAASMREQGFGCWQQIILDTNPAGEFHQLNQMAAPIGGGEIAKLREGEEPSRRVFRSAAHPFTRILSRHKDNPACTPDDIAKLDAQTGPRKANLRYGLWVNAEGQCWPSFDPTVHMQTFDVEWIGDREPGRLVDRREKRIVFKGDRGKDLTERLDVKWAFASMDFGWRNAGCLQVWLVDYQDRIFRTVEILRREQHDDWWTERVVELHCEFELHALVGDCEDPERIVKMNDRLEKASGRGGLAIARGVDKSVRRGNRSKFIPTSLDLVREMLEPTQKGGPRMYWRRNALRSGDKDRSDPRDPISVENRWPTCSEEEIGGFVFEQREDGKPDDEEPAKACKQDGCAATRYAAVFHWLMDPKGPREVPLLPVGTAGWRMGHEEVLRESARNR